MVTPIPPPLEIPRGFHIPTPTLELPRYKHPKWEPIPIKQNDVKAIRESKAKEKQQAEEAEAARPVVPTPALPELPAIPSQIQQFEVPGTDFVVPLPSAEILTTAVGTAGVASVASVGATLAAQAMFKNVVSASKPVIKTLLKKLAAARGKEPPLSWARQKLKESGRRHYTKY